MSIEWDNDCKRCGIGCTHDYCMDCQNRGYDPSCINYKYNKNMKLESFNKKEGGKSKSPPIIEDAMDNVASFGKGDRVILKSNVQTYSSDLIDIAGIELEVDKCFERDLGEGVVAEILYLKGHKNVQNPYLAEHFKKVV